MYKYVIKRILLTIPVLLGAIFLVYAIMYLTPGDPGTLILGITAKPEDIAALNHKLGADLPFFQQFFNYLKNIILHFDFGTSYLSGKPVFTSIMARFPTTFTLALLSIILSSIIGIALGIISAVKQYSWLDNLLTTLAMFFSAMPGFWLGLILMVIFALKLRILPFGGGREFIERIFGDCHHRNGVRRSRSRHADRRINPQKRHAYGAGSHAVLGGAVLSRHACGGYPVCVYRPAYQGEVQVLRGC